MHLLPLWAFMACSRVQFTFTFLPFVKDVMYFFSNGCFSLLIMLISTIGNLISQCYNSVYIKANHTYILDSNTCKHGNC